jgi:hypothetical protein
MEIKTDTKFWKVCISPNFATMDSPLANDPPPCWFLCSPMLLYYLRCEFYSDNKRVRCYYVMTHKFVYKLSEKPKLWKGTCENFPYKVDNPKHQKQRRFRLGNEWTNN